MTFVIFQLISNYGNVIIVLIMSDIMAYFCHWYIL